jgi:hypothetical protein
VTDPTSHIPPRDLPPEARTTGELIQTAFQHVNGLIRGEIALARAEAEESLRSAMVGVALLVVALVMVLVALNVLSAAIVAGLAEAGLAPGWAALIVGVLFLLAAALFAKMGKEALSPDNLAPKRTARNLKRDVETVKEATNDTRG